MTKQEFHEFWGETAKACHKKFPVDISLVDEINALRFTDGNQDLMVTGEKFENNSIIIFHLDLD